MRRQCQKCPWKTSTDPHDIPNGYDVEKHRGLRRTIAEPGTLGFGGGLRMMACHESNARGGELPCVGWIHHQMGDGNNLALRMAAISGSIDVNVETVGPQHPNFVATLPPSR